MAEVDSEITTWMLLGEVVRLVTGAYGGSRKHAEADLMRGLGGRQIRWRGLLRGRKLDLDPGAGSAEFFQGGPSAMLRGPLSESRARRTTVPRARVIIRSAYLDGEQPAKAAYPTPASDYATREAPRRGQG
jgi:hypothetical protein